MTTPDHTMKLIYLGSDIYYRSHTMIGALAHEDGSRSDWGEVEIALERGETVSIRPASDAERARALLEVQRIEAEQ